MTNGSGEGLEGFMYQYSTFALGGSTACLLFLVCSLLCVICVLTARLKKYRRQGQNKKRTGASSSAAGQQKFWIPMSKLADEEETTDGTNIFRQEKSTAVDIEPASNIQETGLFGTVASRPASVPLENSPLEQEGSPQASKPIPIPVPPPPVPPPIPQPQLSPSPAAPSSPRAPSYLSMEPEGQTSLEPAPRKPSIPESSLPRRKPPIPDAFSLPFKRPATPDQSLEPVRHKSPVAVPHVLPVSEVSPTHLAQVLADLSEPDMRPVSAHIYENADSWLTSLIASSRSRAQPEIPDPSPADPFYAVPHPPRKDSQSKPLIPIVDSTSDYVPMTPCNRSHSMRQM